MNPALEQFMKNSNVEDVKKPSAPQNIGAALEGIVAFIQTQLPKVIDVGFTPLCFDLTEDENRLIMGGYHGNIGIFDLPNKKVTKDIELCSCPINSVLFALKDSIVLVLNEMQVLYILDFPSFNLVNNFLLNSIKLTIKPGFLRDSVFISTYTNTVIVYDLKPLESFENRSDLIKREIIVEDVVTCLDICDDGTLIAFGQENGVVALYHGETESRLQCSEAYTAPCDIVQFAQLRKYLAGGFSDGTLIVWNIDSSLSEKKTFYCHNSVITGLAFVKDNRYLVSGGEDMKIVVNDMKVDRSSFYLELFDEKVLCFKTSIDYKKLYYTQDMNKLMIWDVPFLSKNARYKQHEKKVTKVIFINGGFDLLSLGEDGLAILWDYRNDSAQETIEIKNASFTTGIVSSTGLFAFLCSTKPSLLRWSLTTYKYYDYDLNSPVRSIRFSSDENLLALGDDLYRIIVYDAVIMERKYIIKGHTDVVTEIYFIKGDTEILTSSRDHSLVEWNLNTSDKITNFHGHNGPVTCMIVTSDETWIITGSEDHTVIIWSIDNILMHTLPHEGSPKSLFLSSDKTYLMTLQDDMLNCWQMDNLSRIFQKNVEDSYSMTFSADEKTIAIAEGNSIFVEENPLKSSNIRVVGKNYGSSHKFMNYVLEVANGHLRSSHRDIYNHWLFTPYCMGVGHLLSLTNKYETLHPVYLEHKNIAPFCSTINGETPLSISVEMDHKSCIDVCLKYLKQDFGKNNMRAYVPLGACLTKLNLLDISSVPKLYETLYQRCTSNHLPNFCVHGTVLPTLYYSEDFLIKTSNLIPDDCVSTHGLSIVFYHCLVPMDLNNGSNGSIEFLESLLECPYPEIFRSKLLREILQNKWQNVKWAIYIQGMLYILYLVMLSLFCIFFRDSPSFLGALFVLNVLLSLYEVIQISTDFYDYWFDIWNILDQLRGLSCTLYCFLEWSGDSNNNVLLITIIFSWTRGISYFRMFEGTRYMVRLLTEVIKDMKVFFVILFYSTLAFTFIFYLRNPATSFSDFLTVSYRLDLGDFDADYTDPFDWIIFFLATVINPLIMLNLLISIMADTYSKVQETNDIANYQELTGMIIEIEKLMFWKKNQNQQFYLQQCDFLKGNEGERDKVNERIKVLKAKLVEIEKIVSNVKENIKSGKIGQLYGIIQEMSKEREEMQNIIAQNQEMMESTRALLESIYQKLEEKERVELIE